MIKLLYLGYNIIDYEIRKFNKIHQLNNNMGISFSNSDLRMSYSQFNHFKHAICNATGGSFHYHLPESLDENKDKYVAGQWYWGYINDKNCNHSDNKGLGVFLNSSDCEAKIESFILQSLVIDLKQLLPIVRIQDDLTRCIYVHGEFINMNIHYYGLLKKFIVLCEKHIQMNEPLTWS